MFDVVLHKKKRKDVEKTKKRLCTYYTQFSKNINEMQVEHTNLR